MTNVEKRVFRVIGQSFYKFIRGIPCVEDLQNEVEFLNGCLMSEVIESNMYDNLVEILQDCIQFCSP